jgi:hypothetical protein
VTQPQPNDDGCGDAEGTGTAHRGGHSIPGWYTRVSPGRPYQLYVVNPLGCQKLLEEAAGGEVLVIRFVDGHVQKLRGRLDQVSTFRNSQVALLVSGHLGQWYLGDTLPVLLQSATGEGLKTNLGILELLKGVVKSLEMTVESLLALGGHAEEVAEGGGCGVRYGTEYERGVPLVQDAEVKRR